MRRLDFPPCLRVARLIKGFGSAFRDPPHPDPTSETLIRIPFWASRTLIRSLGRGKGSICRSACLSLSVSPMQFGDMHGGVECLVRGVWDEENVVRDWDVVRGVCGERSVVGKA